MKNVRKLVATSIGIAMLRCASANPRGEGRELSTLPAELHADYAIFAQRCSKCHALSRALDSGISDENYWQLYVARMRRQPSSGISQDDAEPILRFLHFYSLEQRQKHEKRPPTAASSEASNGAPPRVRFQ